MKLPENLKENKKNSISRRRQHDYICLQPLQIKVKVSLSSHGAMQDNRRRKCFSSKGKKACSSI